MPSARTPLSSPARKPRALGAPKPAGPDFADRTSRLVAAFRPQAPFLLVTNPVDVGYLTGFLGGDSYLLLSADQKTRPVIISDFRYQEDLEPQRRWCHIALRQRGILEAVAALLADLRVAELAIQAEHLSVAARGALARQANSVKLIDTEGLVAPLRARKDAHEVALIRRAVALQEEALTETLAWVTKTLLKRPLTELDVAATLEAAMKSRGSSKPGFETIVAAGPNGSRPHYRPGPVRLKKNTPLLIDWGATFQGYHGDMTRVFCWGKWPAQVAEIYQIVLEAQQAAAATLAPGRTTAQVDAVARDHIHAAGYGQFFGHGLGHGMGLDGHEDPRLTHMLPPVPLEVGHVVTIEPGIYLPGKGGVRIEDDYLITPSGAENLSTLPKDLAWATR
jgi:Xaa-Pro aminopeptidase